MLGKLSLSGHQRRVALGFLANSAGKGWVVISQFLSLALLTRAWGGDSYGTWLMISAVPTYIALSGLGFGDAAATEMTGYVARGQSEVAKDIFRTAWLLVTSMTVTVFVAAVIIALTVRLFWPEVIAKTDALEGGIALGVYALFTVQTGLVQAGYRSSGRYGQGTALRDLMIPLEAVAAVGAALLGGGFVAAAGGMLLVRAVGLALFYENIRRKEPWFGVFPIRYDRAVASRLWRPALATLGLTFSTALSLQGVIVAIGIASSPAIAASYAATRTFCRTPLQISDLLGRATLPELTMSYAKGEYDRFAKITLFNVIWAAAVVVPVGVIFSLAGPALASLVSGHEISFSRFAFVTLSTAVVFQGIWVAAGQSLQATNNHHVFSFPYIVLALVVAASPFLLSDVPDIAASVGAVSASCELVVLLITAWAWRRQRSAMALSV